jgi:hypothetical protein
MPSRIRLHRAGLASLARVRFSSAKSARLEADAAVMRGEFITVPDGARRETHDARLGNTLPLRLLHGTNHKQLAAMSALREQFQTDAEGTVRRAGASLHKDSSQSSIASFGGRNRISFG